MYTKVSILLLLYVAPCLTFGQTAQVENTDWTFNTTKLVITYDLKSTSPEQQYEVILTLYNGSNKLKPTKGISGAVGKGIYPGEKRKIYWWYKSNGYKQKDLKKLDVSIKLIAQKDTIESSENESEPITTTIATEFIDLEKIGNFTPGISANTLDKGAMEISLINAIFYKQDIFNFTGLPPYRKRSGHQSSFNMNVRGMYGISLEKNVDVGLDISYTSFKISESKFSIIKTGPNVRWRPFGAISESLDLTIQNAIRFVLSDSDNISSNQPEITNQIILTKYYLDHNLLIQLIVGMNLDSKSSNSFFDRKRPLSFPMSFLVGYYPRTNFIVFTGLDHYRTLGTVPWVEEDTRFLRQSATRWPLGAQYIVNNTFNLFLINRFNLSDKSGGGAHSIIFGASMIVD